jgi:cell fate regulator YaaT (PSP1 superfamily)
VKFNPHGKTYDFDPNGIQVKAGDTLIVETSKGLDIGECAYGEHYVTDESVVRPLRPLIRAATEEDLRVAAQNKLREKEAFATCREKIAAHGLAMKLVDVECGFEGNKILFFFTADGRVDFRELVKDLAGVFRTRIELRQIGVRDETKMLGGLGICGRPYCCSQFLNDFQPVSTKMAKTQSMSLNPAKISGSCGRLMCCLRYEQDAYEALVRSIPKLGAFVQTPLGYGNVVAVNVLRQKVRVCLDKEGEQEFKVMPADEIAVVPGGRPKPGEPLPQVLVAPVRKAETQEPEEEDPWAAPVLFAEDGEPQRRNAENGDQSAAPPKNENRGQEKGWQRSPGGGKGKAWKSAGPPARKAAGAEQGQKPQNGERQVQAFGNNKPRSAGEQPKGRPRGLQRGRKHSGKPKPRPEGQAKG